MKCTYCQEEKESVQLQEDPFEVELYDDYSKHYLCAECVQQKREEV